MSKFIVTLRHDHGTFNVYVTARNAQAARVMVCASENCPMRAIRCVRRVGWEG